MPLSRWLRKNPSSPSSVGQDQSAGHARLAEPAGEPVKMTGTTTFGAEALTDLFVSRGQSAGGCVETSGLLVAEPDNPVDSHAIAVHVEGRKVGYLPGYVAAQLPTARGGGIPCQVQLWGAVDRGKLRVIGWAAFGSGAVTWPHSAENPPAIAVADQRAAEARGRTELVNEALEGDDPLRAAQFQVGMVQGYHYLEMVEPINELKREKRLDEALTLCYAAIAGAEADSGPRAPAPWYTLQAAIIHRKLHQKDEEIAVLERWLRACPPRDRATSKVQERLDKLNGASS